MALSPEQAEEVTAILQEHPDWPTSQVRAEAGLSPRELFAVKRLRTTLGIPEPGKPDGARPSNRGGRPRKAAAAEADTLDDTPAEPTGPKRRGGPGRPKSPLAPILPRIAQTIAGAVLVGSHRMTGGRAPMTPTEAKAIAVPIVRIADREIAKHWKASGKAGENAEDVGLILMTVLAWLAGVIIASVSGKPRQVGIVATPDTHPDTLPADLFAGSEPAQAATPPATPAVRPAASTPAASDESDLFAGSEPLAAGTAAGPMGNGRAAAVAGPAGALSLNDAQWAAIMPTDLGGPEVG